MIYDAILRSLFYHVTIVISQQFQSIIYIYTCNCIYNIDAKSSVSRLYEVRNAMTKSSVIYSMKWNKKKSKRNKRHVHTLLLYILFAIQKSIERERRKADSYYDREQTYDCIGGGGIPRLTTLCGSIGSSGLLLQLFHLLLVCLLFLCKPRKPTCVTLKSRAPCVHTTRGSPDILYTI